MNRYVGFLRGVLVASAILTLNITVRGEGPRAVETFEVGTLRVEKFGDGKRAVVLVPGLGGGTWVWKGVIERLAKDHVVYSLTLPGFDGRASVTERPLFGAFKRDFWKMLRERRIDRPVVVGHSLGGTLAIALAEEHSERLSGVVSVDGLPIFPMLARATKEQRKQMAQGMAATFEGMSKEQMLEAQKRYMGSVGTNRAEEVERLAALVARSDAKAMAAWMREDVESDLRKDLGEVTVPLMVLMPYDPAEGEGLMGISRERKLGLYRALVAGAKKASVRVIEPAKHFVMVDQAEAFDEAAVTFVNQVQKEGSTSGK